MPFYIAKVFSRNKVQRQNSKGEQDLDAVSKQDIDQEDWRYNFIQTLYNLIYTHFGLIANFKYPSCVDASLNMILCLVRGEKVTRTGTELQTTSSKALIGSRKLQKPVSDNISRESFEKPNLG